MFLPVIIAIVVGLVLGAAWVATRRTGAVVLATLWLGYAGYEYLMFRRVLCSGECNIRVDLLLIYPLLLAATLWLTASLAWRAWVRRKRGEVNPQRSIAGGDCS